LQLKHHEAISRDKFDLGRTDTLMHEIALKTTKPIYVNQFKIPDAHHQEVEHSMSSNGLNLALFNQPVAAITAQFLLL
jgi:hypothetical protein